MTVAELIEKLRGMPQHLPVVTYNYEYGVHSRVEDVQLEEANTGRDEFKAVGII